MPSGLHSIPDFMFLVFWPRFGDDAGVTYDPAGWVHNDAGTPSIIFGAQHSDRRMFTANGRVIFTYYGTLVDVLPAEEDPYINTASQFLDLMGYYLVQTGPGTYDMVSARDAVAWITWEF